MPRAPSVPPEIEEKIISRWDNRDTMKGLADEFKLELRQVTYLLNVKRWRKRKKERNKNCINGEKRFYVEPSGEDLAHT